MTPSEVEAIEALIEELAELAVTPMDRRVLAALRRARVIEERARGLKFCAEMMLPPPERYWTGPDHALHTAIKRLSAALAEET